MPRKDHMELHRVLRIAGSRRCRDKAVYIQGRLIGAITRCDRHWCVWSIDETFTVKDPCRFSHYTDQMELMAIFGTYSEAKAYVRGPFTGRVLPPDNPSVNEHSA
ncbi:MAG: hypothetical protein JSV26_12370 [bacterium]|nr:MAG: hypothetical protein JSV26_12370 [bacterium]